MLDSRLTLAVQEHGLLVPSDGRIVIFAPRTGFDLSALPKEHCDIIQTNKPDSDAFAMAGYSCAVQETGDYGAAVVCLPRAKAQARDLIARAAALGGMVIVDGQKTDGSESVLKECRKRADVAGVVSKAHGKLSWFTGGDFSDWLAGDARQIDGGFVTAPGVYSADGLDPESKALEDRFD